MLNNDVLVLHMMMMLIVDGTLFVKGERTHYCKLEADIVRRFGKSKSLSTDISVLDYCPNRNMFESCGKYYLSDFDLALNDR